MQQQVLVGGPSLYYVSKGTGWVGSEKWQFLMRFSTIYAGVGWLGESEKVQKHGDVIQGWSLRPFIHVQMRKKMKHEYWRRKTNQPNEKSSTFHLAGFLYHKNQITKRWWEQHPRPLEISHFVKYLLKATKFKQYNSSFIAVFLYGVYYCMKQA